MLVLQSLGLVPSMFSIHSLHGYRKVEGSRAAARLTAELLRSVISLQKLPQEKRAAALIEAVRGIGEKLIAANPVGKFLVLLIQLCL